jgi:sulfur carrier protein
MQIEILLNGERTRVPQGCSVAQLVESLGLGGEPIAVERNERVVRRADHGRTGLLEGDRVEVVTLVGGG